MSAHWLLPTASARAFTCTFCDAPPAISCTTEGPAADHFSRYRTALEQGLLGRADILGVIATLTVIADGVLIPVAESLEAAA